MRNVCIAIAAVILLGVGSGSGSTLMEMQKWYQIVSHPEGREEAWHIHELVDGTFILTGLTTSVGDGSRHHAFFLRLSADGQTEINWSPYVTPNNGQSVGYELHPVSATTNPDFIFAGRTTEYGGEDQALIMLLNSNFVEQWRYHYSEPGWQSGAFSVQKIAVGNETGFIVAGFARDQNDNHYTDALLVRLDDQGGPEWERRFDFHGDYDIFKSIRVGTDGFYAAGFTRKPSSATTGQFDVLLAKIGWDGTLDSSWPSGTPFGTTSGGEFAQNLKPVGSSSWIFAGGNYTNNKPHGYIGKTRNDGTGAVDWEVNVEIMQYDYLQSITPLDQGLTAGDFVAIGITYGVPFKALENLVAKVDQNGNVVYKRNFGGEEYDYGYWIQPTADGAFVVAGATTSGTQDNNAEIFVSKFWTHYCGDVDGSGAINSADVIYLNNYIFKSGPPPVPDLSYGDVNGDGNCASPVLTSGDVIHLSNMVFRGALPNCHWCAGP